MAGPIYRFRPIKPKRPPIKPPSTLKMLAALSVVGRDLQARMAKYPPKKSGGTYKRTGTLGRAWTMEGPKVKGQDLVVIVGNKVVYAGFVQGFKTRDPRQVPTMATLGWQSIEVTGQAVVAEHKALVLASLKPT